MRILANYGYKNNGDSYSVTFETTGDVPIEKAPSTVDTLFILAKEAIQRQVAAKDNDPLGIDPSKDASSQNNNSNHYHQDSSDNNSKSSGNGNGKDYGANGNGSNSKAKITANQKKFLYRLLYSNKKLSGDDATAYLKKEFNVQYVNEILCSQATLIIQKLLQAGGDQKRGDGHGDNGSYQRQPN